MGRAWHQLSGQEALRLLKATADGLLSREAQKRLEKYGKNELQKARGMSPVRLFCEQFTNTLVLILIVAVLFSAAIGEALDAAVILVILLLNAVLGFVQEYRAEKAIDALKKLAMPESVVVRDGKRQKIPSTGVVPGDIVVLAEGDKVAADVRLLETVGLRIDESSLTGESVPVSKTTAPLGAASVADRVNMVFMGTAVTYGRGTGVVVATGMSTELGKIAHLIQETPDEQTPLQEKLDVFGRELGMVILGVSLLVVAMGVLRGLGVLDMIVTGIALAVAAIPEGLPAVVTITLALALQRLARRNAIIRKLPAVETLGSTQVICADKTGTVTKNEMTVQRIFTDTTTITVGHREGAGVKKDTPMVPEVQLLLTVSSLCTNVSRDGTRVIGDPTEAALVVAADNGGLRKPALEQQYPRIREIPFSSERKMMTTVHRKGRGFLMCVKGATEMVLRTCTHIHTARGVRPITARDRQRIDQVNQQFADQALRVLAIAYKETRTLTAIEEGLVFLGLVGMMDPPREGVNKQIKRCREAGIQVVMITGDHQNTAVAVAKQIGLLDRGTVLTGAELGRLSDEELGRVIEKVRVYARVNPADKVRILEAFKRKGAVVAMTGDGVNDAPALKRADIGIAMGINGTEVAKEASDMVLADDNFASIVSAVEGGRHVYDNIRKFILYLLSSNMGEMLVVFVGMLLGLPLPLVAVQLLWMNLITDGLPAIALGTEPAEPDIMRRPPRDPQEPILNRQALAFIGTVGAIMLVGTLGVFYLSLTTQGWQPGMVLGPEDPVYVYATTMVFTTLVLFQLWNVLNARSVDHSLRAIGVFTNRKLLLAVAISLGLQLAVVYVPALQALFATTALAAADWLLILAVSATILVVMQVKVSIQR